MERTTITDTDLRQYLSAGEQDGRLSPRHRPVTNKLRANENGVVVFASSTGNQLSLLHGGTVRLQRRKVLMGARRAPQAHAISISDLEGYVSRRLSELTKGRQTPMTAKPKTVQDFWIAVRQ
jgi:hypothetical protein